MDIKKKILVTGADGFIGSHLTERLVRAGYDVRAFVLYNSFNSWGWLDDAPVDIKKSLDIFSGDIRDPYGVRKAMEGCDTVLHLAALIAIPYSYHSPDTYVDTNIKGTLNVVQAARDFDVKVVHTSTSEVYGTALTVPISESHPLQGQSPYSASKIGADQIALSFYSSFETPVTVLRPTRDFNYVKDTVSAFEKIMQSDAAIGTVVNAGSGFEISIGDTVKMIADVMGVEVSIKTDEQRLRPEKSEVERLLADNSRLKTLTDWSPQYGSLEGMRQGLQETVEWFSSPDNLARYKAERYNI